MSEMPQDKKHSGGTDAQHDLKAKVPDFTPKWSKEAVIPYNVLKEADANVEMVVDAVWPEDRPFVDLVVQKADPEGDVEIVPFNKLKAKKVVDKGGNRPVFRFSLRNDIWDPYDKLLYHFTARIDQLSKKTAKAVKVKRWHVQALDIGDTRPAIMGFRNQESANHLASFSASADDQVESHRFDANADVRSDFGSWMRNTYSFNYTGHGGVVCNTCGSMYDCDFTAGPTFGDWTTCPTDASHSDPRSTHCIGAMPWFQASHVLDEAVVLRAPRYLMFSVCCGGAYEPSLYNAYRTRGTMYCIGFRKSTRCDWARDYTKSFFDTWCKTHQCDPKKIPEIFDAMQATWDAKLKPVLFQPAPPPPPKPPSLPTLPSVPQVPQVPSMPQAPQVPQVPQVPTPPQVPQLPTAPPTPSGVGAFVQSAMQTARQAAKLIKMLF
jgi:hypothetical protein